MNTYVSIAATSGFLIYSACSFILLAVFARLYVWSTPYNEMVHIKQGCLAPAYALGGAMLGFTLPLVSMSYHGLNLLDFLIWSTIAGVFQLVLFRVMYKVIPMDVEANNQAVGVLYACAAVCVGLINAFSLIPA